MNNFDKILSVVGSERGLSPSQITGRDRRDRFVSARYEVAYMARKHLDYSLPRIGERLHRDHTSVMNGLRRVQRKMQNRAYFIEIMHIEDRVKDAIG